MNILIIDNTDYLREFCKHILEVEGHTIRSADYHSFKEILTNEFYNYDIIILNIFPTEEELNLKLYNEITDLAPQAQIILLTIKWDTYTLIKLLKKGCKKIEVPFNRFDLLSAVEDTELEHI
jgi:DNA-binding NtrC family response regulator